MAKLDLTLREVEEAQSYGLTPTQYDDLKSKLYERFTRKVKDDLASEARKALRQDKDFRNEIAKEMRDGVLSTVEAELRNKLPKELRPKIEEELRPKVEAAILPDLRKKAEADLRDKLLGEVREVEKEVAGKVPSVRDREAFRDFIREVEIDCMTQADSASNDSDSAASTLNWRRRLRAPLSWGLLLAVPVLGFFLHRQFGAGLGFWAFLLPIVAAATGFASMTRKRIRSAAQSMDSHCRIASDYWVMTERAKRLRIVTTECAQTRGSLWSALNEFAQEKKALDDRYWPSARSFEKSRAEIRTQLLSEIDPDKLLRIADTRVEEFEALEEFDETQEPTKNEKRRAS
jgi:hypothetical protein